MPSTTIEHKFKLGDIVSLDPISGRGLLRGIVSAIGLDLNGAVIYKVNTTNHDKITRHVVEEYEIVLHEEQK